MEDRMTPPNDDHRPKTISVPEAGAQYFGLAKNASYEAAARGQIPAIRGLEAACACRYASLNACLRDAIKLKRAKCVPKKQRPQNRRHGRGRGAMFRLRIELEQIPVDFTRNLRA